LNNLGLAYADAGDLRRAVEALKHALRLSEMVGDPAGVTAARQNLEVVRERAALVPESLARTRRVGRSDDALDTHA
jgi:hypothetical protein